MGDQVPTHVGRRGLDADAWNDLHECLTVIEAEALATMREFAAKHKDSKT